MGNISEEQIKRKFASDKSDMKEAEDYFIKLATSETEGLLEQYNKLTESRNGKYINSDLMKMVFPIYKKSKEYRFKYNMAITNSAAVLTNELYNRTIKKNNVDKCIYIAGPYGAGKSYFVQSLFEGEYGNELLEKSIVYEGSITPPYFDQKIRICFRE